MHESVRLSRDETLESPQKKELFEQNQEAEEITVPFMIPLLNQPSFLARCEASLVTQVVERLRNKCAYFELNCENEMLLLQHQMSVHRFDNGEASKSDRECEKEEMIENRNIINEEDHESHSNSSQPELKSFVSNWGRNSLSPLNFAPQGLKRKYIEENSNERTRALEELILNRMGNSDLIRKTGKSDECEFGDNEKNEGNEGNEGHEGKGNIPKVTDQTQSSEMNQSSELTGPQYALKVPAEIWPPPFMHFWASSFMPPTFIAREENENPVMQDEKVEFHGETERTEESKRENRGKPERTCVLCTKSIFSLAEYKQHEKQHRKREQATIKFSAPQQFAVCNSHTNAECLLCTERMSSLIELQLHLKTHFSD